MKIEQLCQHIKEYLSQFSYVHVLMPISSIILYVLSGLRVLNYFTSFGSLINTLVFVLYFGALLLVFSECKFRDLAIGTGAIGAIKAITVARSLFSGYLNNSALIYLLLYGLVAYACYKKSLQANQ